MRETQFGEALAHTAKNILQELKQLDETLDRLTRDNSVVVNVGVLPVAAVGVMPGVVARLSERRPELQVMVSQGLSEDLIPDLMAGRLDLIVGRLYDPPAPDGLRREPLYQEPISVVAQPDHRFSRARARRSSAFPSPSWSCPRSPPASAARSTSCSARWT
ncbi:MAG: LysR substrate-binding domain-containing protein [Caulobacteraceae bacterium]